MGCCGVGNDVDDSEVKRHDIPFDGPVRERRCQDVLWLILLIIFLVGIVAAVAHAVCKGDIDRILRGMDSYGNVCGKKNEKIEGVSQSGKDYREQTYVQREQEKATITINCVAKCKNNATSFFHRCIPASIYRQKTGVTNIFSPAGNKTGFFREAAGDVQYCWREIIYLCLISFGLTIVIMFLLRFLAAFIIYLAMVVMIVVSIAGTAYIWYQYTRAKKLADENKSQPNAQNLIKNSRNWLVGAVLSTVFCLFTLFILFAMRKRIKLVIALFKEAGKAIAKMPFLLIQPFWTFLCLVIIGASWLYALMWMQSSGDIVVANNKANIEQDTFIQVMKWYHVFGLLWLTWFCIGCQHVVIAGAVAKWFFTRDKSQVGYPILTAIKWVIRYHLGSVAFGSLIISIVKYIRLVLRFIEKNMRDSRNPTITCLFCLVQCCLKCFENCLKFIARNAYIEIAIYGYSFCKAARQAFKIIMNNSLRVTAINSVGDFALFMAKASVVVSVAFIGMEMIKPKPLVTHLWVPVVLACLFAYLIADCFITVYEMIIDTLFICFCEDCEINDGISRPYFMSTSLMKFVQDSSKELDAIKPHPKQQQQQQ